MLDIWVFDLASEAVFEGATVGTVVAERFDTAVDLLEGIANRDNRFFGACFVGGEIINYEMTNVP